MTPWWSATYHSLPYEALGRPHLAGRRMLRPGSFGLWLRHRYTSALSCIWHSASVLFRSFGFLTFGSGVGPLQALGAFGVWTFLFDLAVNSIMRTDAVISECGRYRYQLSRSWSDGPKCLFIRLNPSTADASNDDPTIRRCIGFARAWGYGGLCIGNLFPFRATYPKALLGPVMWNIDGNEEHLRSMRDTCSLVLCAWGNGHIVKKVMMRFPGYLPLQSLGELNYIGLAKDGTPKHPLYLKGGLQPRVIILGNA